MLKKTIKIAKFLIIGLLLLLLVLPAGAGHAKSHKSRGRSVGAAHSYVYKTKKASKSYRASNSGSRSGHKTRVSYRPKARVTRHKAAPKRKSHPRKRMHAASPRKTKPRVKSKHPSRHASHKAEPKHKASPKHKNKKASKSKTKTKASKKHSNSKKRAKTKASHKHNKSKKKKNQKKAWTIASGVVAVAGAVALWLGEKRHPKGKKSKKKKGNKKGKKKTTKKKHSRLKKPKKQKTSRNHKHPAKKSHKKPKGKKKPVRTIHKPRKPNVTIKWTAMNGAGQQFPRVYVNGKYSAQKTKTLNWAMLKIGWSNLKKFGPKFAEELVGVDDVKTLLNSKSTLAQNGMSIFDLLITYFPATKALKIFKAMEAERLVDKGIETTAALEKVSKAAGLSEKETKALDELTKSEQIGVKSWTTSTTETDASVSKKLQTYLLDKNHTKGASKAKWFKQALGFDQSNWKTLAKQIKFVPKDAVKTGENEFGIKYNQIIRITGVNGRKIEVTFAWIKNKDGVMRLVTAIPTKK